MSYQRQPSRVYQHKKPRSQLSSSKKTYDAAGFRRNFLENLNPALKSLQQLAKDRWQVQQPTQAILKSEAEQRAKSLKSSGYETTFIPIKNADWGSDPMGFLAFREKPKPKPTPTENKSPPTPKSQTPTYIFEDSVTKNFTGYSDADGNPATMTTAGGLLISSDQVVVGSNFSKKPNDPAFQDVQDRLETSVNPGEEVIEVGFDSPKYANGLIGVVENQKKIGKPSDYFSIKVGQDTFYYGVEPAIRAFKSFDHHSAVKGYVDDQRTLVLVDDKKNFIAIAPVIGGDPIHPAIVNAIKIGGRP